MKRSFAAILPVLLLAFSARAANPKYIIAQGVWEVDANADGTSVPFSVVTYTYDDVRLIRTVSEFDTNWDGIMDVQHTFISTYNADGQLVVVTNESRTLPDGMITARSTIRYEYKDQGRL